MDRAGGRPTLLTPEVLEDVRRLLPTVLYLETVGDYLGVERTTWRKWLRRGRKEALRLRNPRCKPKESEAVYLEFFHTYKRALAEGELYDAGVIKKASAEQWQAAAWRLERRHPDRWGRKERREITGKDGGPVVLALEDMAAADRELEDWERERSAERNGRAGAHGAS